MGNKLLGLILLGGAGYYAYTTKVLAGGEENKSSFSSGVGGFQLFQPETKKSFRGAPSPSEKPSNVTGLGEPIKIVINESSDYSSLRDLQTQFSNQIEQQKLAKEQQEINKIISENKKRARRERMISEATNITKGISLEEFTKKYGKTKAETRKELGIPQPTVSPAPERSFFEKVSSTISSVIKYPSLISDFIKRL